jgi:hypothetical protein
MREDSSVHPFDVFVLGTLVLAFAMAVNSAFRSGDDDPNWEMRWRGLAEEFSRRERRRRAYIDLATLWILALVAALVLIGLLPNSTVGLILAAYAVTQGVVVHLRERQIKRRYQQVQALYLGTPAAEAVQKV